MITSVCMCISCLCQTCLVFLGKIDFQLDLSHCQNNFFYLYMSFPSTGTVCAACVSAVTSSTYMYFIVFCNVALQSVDPLRLLMKVKKIYITELFDHYGHQDECSLQCCGHCICLFSFAPVFAWCKISLISFTMYI